MSFEANPTCARGAQVIKRFIMHAKKTAFVVEHDFIMATYLADRVVVYTGEPGVECTANAPVGLVEGMNQFLKQLSVTFRRDPESFRPRVNKKDSLKDREQKSARNYFAVEEEESRAAQRRAEERRAEKRRAEERSEEERGGEWRGRKEETRKGKDKRG